jgi:hypothetical protein
VTIQWRFSDADPWYIRIDNGSTEAVHGEAPHPSLTLDTSWRDFLEVSTYGGDPRRAMLRRKVRPHGSLKLLWRMRRIFPRGSSPR